MHTAVRCWQLSKTKSYPVPGWADISVTFFVTSVFSFLVFVIRITVSLWMNFSLVSAFFEPVVER